LHLANISEGFQLLLA